MDVTQWHEVSSWQPLTENSTEATFFHTPAWHEIIVRTYPPYEIATRQYIFEDGTRAVVPFIQTKQGGFLKGKARLKSSVWGGYGGIISEKNLSPDQQNLIYENLLGLKASISIDSNPFSGYTLPDSFIVKDDFTHIFPLNQPEENLLQSLSRGAKSNLNQAIKKGVTVRTAETENDIASYYSMYQDTLKRWGEATLFSYSEDLFFTIFKDAGDRAQFWLAEIDGKIIAGVLIFYWNKVVSYWHGASLKDYFSYYPNNMLHMEIAKDAAKKNYSYYDFGPSGGQQGVVRFKESFGTVRHSFDSGHWKKKWGTSKQA